MRSSSLSILAFLFTLSAGLVGCKGADGDTCKEDNDCSGALMCCRVSSTMRGSCGVICEVATDSGPTPDSGPVGDVPMMSDAPLMSDAPDSGSPDAMVDANDSGPVDVGVDAPMDAGSDSGSDAGPDAGDADVTDAGPDADVE